MHLYDMKISTENMRRKIEKGINKGSITDAEGEKMANEFNQDVVEKVNNIKNSVNKYLKDRDNDWVEKNLIIKPDFKIKPKPEGGNEYHQQEETPKPEDVHITHDTSQLDKKTEISSDFDENKLYA